MSRRVLAFVVVLAVALFALLVVTWRPPSDQNALVFSYSSTDAGPGGTLALRRWVASLGYTTSTLQGSRFSVPSNVRVAFVIGPLEAVQPGDAETLAEWVSRGGTAIVASDRSVIDEALFTTFGVELTSRPPGAVGGEISPALARPPFRDLRTSTARALRLAEPAAVLVGDGDRALVVEKRVGRGRVILSSAPDMLANVNLGAAQNGSLVLNFLADAPAGSVVAFDEYHHGAHVEPDAMALFTETAPGHAFLFIGAAVFLYVALRGRRFGASLPLEERPARSSLDYIRSFAGLLRRSGARALAGERLARLYRRRFARAAGIRVTSDTPDVLAALRHADPREAAAVEEVLTRLEGPVNDNDLLVTVERAEAIAGEVERS